MRVGFLQMRPRFGAVDANTSAIEQALARVRDALVVLPELCTTGYLVASRAELETLAEPAAGPTATRLMALARRNRLTVCWGFAERDGRRIYNSAQTVTPAGKRTLYRKAHLFDREKLFFDVPRGGFACFAAAGTRAGMMICFDWVFPEACRALALGGARIVLHPSNLVLPYCQQAMTTRCIENRVFAITCNRVGRESHGGRSLRFTGRSQIVGPRGEVLVRASATREELRLASIDPTTAVDKHMTLHNDLIGDRRPELYRMLVARHRPH
jgi:predicted amidohydrolase